MQQTPEPDCKTPEPDSMEYLHFIIITILIIVYFFIATIVVFITINSYK